MTLEEFMALPPKRFGLEALGCESFREMKRMREPGTGAEGAS